MLLLPQTGTAFINTNKKAEEARPPGKNNRKQTMLAKQLSLLIHRNLIGLLLLPSLFISTSLHADELTERLKTLVNTQNSQSAYTLAAQNRASYEGDPVFDLYYGMAAIDSGHVNEGVFALERVVYQQPNNHNARLELARGYYLQGDDTRARQAFERVLKVNPPKSVVANIERFLDAIRLREGRYRTSARGYIELEAGHDSNVNSGPDSDQIDGSIALPFGLQLALNDDLLEKNDNFRGLAAGGQLNVPLTQHASIFARADTLFRQYSHNTQYDNDVITVQGGAQWLAGQQRRRLSVLAQRFRVDDATSRNMHGITAENTWLWDGQRQFSINATIARLLHPGVPLNDVNQYMLGGSYTHSYQDFQWTASLSAGKNVPKESSNNATRKNIYAARIGGQWSVDPKTGIGLNLTASHSAYTEPFSFFLGSLPPRKETLLTTELTYTYLLDKHWKLRANASYQRNLANIDMFDYKRTQAKVGLRYEF